MPVARPTSIPVICEWIMKKKPQTVLDLGIGFGLYGFLARNYGVIWRKGITKEVYENWKNEIRVDGVEIADFLITPLQELIYNNIYIGDMIKIAPTLGNYDLIIMGDSIEHIEKDEALELIEKLRSQGTLIMTTPNYWKKGVAVLGNEHEKHKCFLEDNDFVDNPLIIHESNQKVIIYEK